MTDPVVVYHVPYPLDPHSTSASGIRPVRMRDAFTSIGCQVLEVSGNAAQRREGIRAVERFIAKGGKVDLVYSESSTMPTLLTEPHHFPTHPALDFSFFARMKRQGARIGLFYRDIYWRFPEYDERVGHALAFGMKRFYHYDLRRYASLLDRLYLPSMRMAEHVPIVPRRIIRPLPPGTEPKPRNPERGGGLELFYVGGISEHYRLTECVKAVAGIAGATLTICTRKAEWAAVRAEYEALAPRGLEVVHESGSQLDPRFDRADIAVLFVEPQPYRDFAVPFKYFEYLGRGIPVLASEGTLVGEMVANDGVGWTIPYSASAADALLRRLIDHREEIEAKSSMARTVGERQTWEARARTVVEDLVTER